MRAIYFPGMLHPVGSSFGNEGERTWTDRVRNYHFEVSNAPTTHQDAAGFIRESAGCFLNEQLGDFAWNPCFADRGLCGSRNPIESQEERHPSEAQ